MNGRFAATQCGSAEVVGRWGVEGRCSCVVEVLECHDAGFQSLIFGKVLIFNSNVVASKRLGGRIGAGAHIDVPRVFWRLYIDATENSY